MVKNVMKTTVILNDKYTRCKIYYTNLIYIEQK